MWTTSTGRVSVEAGAVRCYRRQRNEEQTSFAVGMQKQGLDTHLPPEGAEGWTAMDARSSCTVEHRIGNPERLTDCKSDNPDSGCGSQGSAVVGCIMAKNKDTDRQSTLLQQVLLERQGLYTAGMLCSALLTGTRKKKTNGKKEGEFAGENTAE